MAKQDEDNVFLPSSSACAHKATPLVIIISTRLLPSFSPNNLRQNDQYACPKAIARLLGEPLANKADLRLPTNWQGNLKNQRWVRCADPVHGTPRNTSTEKQNACFCPGVHTHHTDTTYVFLQHLYADLYSLLAQQQHSVLFNVFRALNNPI